MRAPNIVVPVRILACALAFATCSSAQRAARTAHGVAAGPFYDAPTDDEADFAPFVESGTEDGQKQGRVPAGNPYTLAFAAGSFEPERGVDPRVRAIREAEFFGYVMLRGRMTSPDKLRKLDALGVQRLGAHTWQSWVARIPRARVDAIAALPFVHWVGLARPEQKIHPILAAALDRALPGDRLRVDVSVFASDRNAATRVERVRPVVPLAAGASERQELGALEFEIPNGPMHRALVAAGLDFEHYTDTGNVFVFRGRATPAAIARMRELNFVAAIEETAVFRCSDDQSQAMIGQDAVRAAYGGGAVTVGVIDSGLWSPTVAQRHQDFQDKWLQAWDNVGNGAYNDENGHGTAVTGVMIGSGTADARYRGGAPEIGRAATRRVFVGRLLDASGFSVGSAATLYRAMSTDFTDSSKRVTPKPRVINNSWGSSPPAGRPWSGTESACRTVDSYVFNGGQTYVFSSGNDGPTQAASRPAVAKNAIGVGSCEDTTSGGVLPGDLVASSAGGTADSRRKPDVLAPGRWACTTSSNTTTGYADWGGTSFASPHVAGVVASLIDHHSFLDYQPAQIKALLCAAAEWQGDAGSTTGYFGTRLGHGLVDAVKAHGSATTGWFSGTSRSNLTRSGQWVSWDVAVPQDAQHVSLFLCWDEPAASALALAARVNDVRLYVDLPPYSAAGNVGDFSVSSNSSNVISKVGSAWAASLRGKTIRIKAYAQSVTSQARLGMCMLWMTKSHASYTPDLLVGVTQSVLRPGEAFQMATELRADALGHHFDNGHIVATLPAGFTITQLRRVGLDQVVQLYTDGNHPSAPWPSFANGMTVGQGTRRGVLWSLVAPRTSGTYQVGARARVDPNNRTIDAGRSVCVDGIAPPAVSSLTSSSHFVNRWSNKDQVTLVWAETADSGCAGTSGYAYRVAHGAEAPTTRNIAGSANTQRTVNLTSGTAGWYFNIKAVDFADNFSAKTSTIGPFLIDTVDPVISGFQINNDAERTNALVVQLRQTATDSYSGVHEMRFSSNGALWSAWQSFSNGPVSYDMSQFGGNTQDGPKQVWIEVRDRAGNTKIATDTIIYDSMPPIVTSVQINGGASATTSTNVQVTVKGAGIPSQMRFSSDGSTWGPWRAYSEAAQSYDLTSNGGSTATGSKRVYCMMRDVAQNESTSQWDSILYYTIPTIDAASTNKVPVVHDTALVLTGKFAEITRVIVGAQTLAVDDPHEWMRGNWRKRGDTRIEVYLPQNVDVGLQPLRVGNPAFYSAALGVERTHNAATFFQCAPEQVAGKNVDLVLHRGKYPADGITVLSLSASPNALRIPGLITLEHGGNATTLIDPSFLTLGALPFDASKRTAHWVLPTLPTMKGAKVFFEPLLFDVHNLTKLPIDTANRDVLLLQ